MRGIGTGPQETVQVQSVTGPMTVPSTGPATLRVRLGVTATVLQHENDRLYVGGATGAGVPIGAGVAPGAGVDKGLAALAENVAFGRETAMTTGATHAVCAN